MGFNLDRRTNNQAKQVGSFDLDRLGKSDKSRFKSDFKQAVKIGKDGKQRNEQEEERKKTLNNKITETVENNRGKLAADIFNKNNSNLKENKSKNETVIQKYGINPETFSTNDLNKWAQEHNFTVMANSSGIYYTPKYEGGLFGIGGRKKTTDTEDKDFKVLEQLAANNTRKRLSNTDMGAFASAAFGMADGATFGVIGALGDKKQKRAYEKAGLPNENFVSFSQARKATSDKHPIADIAGNVGGSLLGFHLAEGLIGAGLSTIPKYTNLAEKAAKGISSAQKTKNLIDTAATVGLTTAGTSAANQEWKKSNWYKSVGNMAIDTAVSSLGAVMGGKFASVVGEKFANTLYKSTKLKPEVIKALTSSAGALSFAGTATGISEMKNAAYCAANNTKYTPNIQDIATNMIVLSLFSGLKTYASEKFGTTSTPKVEEPFEFFTEKEMKSPELLKNKMREYTKKYHPDKFYAMGEDAVKKATDRMSAINAEYERAKARCALNILSDVRKNESNARSNGKAGRQRTHKNATDAIILLNEIYAPENNSVDFVKPRAQSVIAASEQSTKIPKIAIKGSGTPKIVPLTQVGDFYEAYGNEAVELADKLNLTPTYKTINGEKVQMVGFPVNSLERYTQALGNDYNSSVSDTQSINEQNMPVSTENTVVNEDATDTGIINHTKEVDGLKLINTEENTLINGKTLITGVYELNSDKDFGRKSYRKEKFDYFRKAGSPWTETANGTTYGHYSFYKYKDGRYLIMHLPTGMGVTDAKTESKAKSLIKALDDKLPELPISIQAFGDGYRCCGMTQEISTSIKNIINSANEPVVMEIQDGKVPFNTKTGLVDYVKAHIGDKVRVTFNNGASEVRTLEGISNASMRTKKLDGSDIIADLKGVKYNDSGFSIEYGAGISATYDFVNTADSAENSVVETATPETVNTSQDNDAVDTDIYNTDETDTSSPENMYENLKKLGLTYDEQHAILEYKSSGSYTFNEKSRNGKTLSEAEEKQKKDLNSALDKFPKYKGIVYRNIGFPNKRSFEAFVQDHSKTLVTYAAFTSCSKTTDGYLVTDAPYLVHYEIESLSGRDVSSVGVVEEQEILYKTDTSFEISSIEVSENTVNLKLKEIDSNGKGKLEGTLENGRERQSSGGNDSETEHTGIAEEVSGTSDIIRGRSSAYDEVYNGASERNGGRIGSGSRTQDLGGNTETGNDGERKGPLSGIESDKHIIREENSANSSELHGITPSVRGGGVEDVGVFENAPGSDSGINEASREKDNGRNEREAGIVGEPEGLNVRTLNVDTEKITNAKGVNKIISSINKGEDISLESVKNAVGYLINSESDIKTELSALKNSDLQKLLNPIDRSRRTKKADMVDGVYSNMLEEMYYAVTGSDTISYIFDGTPIDTRMKNILSESVEKLNKDDFSKLKEKNAAAYSEVLRKRNAKEEALKNPKTYEDFVHKKNVMGLSEEETAQFEKMFAEGRKKYREQKKTAKTNDVGEAKAFFSDDSKYTVEKTTHTKTGEDIWVVKPKERIDTESWKQLNEQMKAMGGSYWRGNQGWNFKNDPTASLAGLSEETGVKSSMPSTKRLRKIADGMQKSIDDKFKDRLTNTAKRAREAANAEAEGDRLKMIQSTINNIADVIESGENTLLDKIDSKAQVETLIKMLNVSRRNKINETMPGITYNERLEEQDKPYSNDDIKYAEYPLSRLHENILNEYISSADGKTGYKQIVQRLTKVLKTAENHYVKIDRQSFSDIDKIVKNLQSTRADYWNDEVSERKRLARMGIENAVELRAYLREFINYLPGQDAEAKKQQSIKIRERELANSKIEGFFPTPKQIVEQMLDEADIKPGEKVLEPSAGKGNIADEIKSKFPNNALDVVEWNTSLSELLSDKCHNVVGNDFLKTDSKYDKIIMNPPFEKMQDIDHVKHAYDLLNPGGRVVAIMSESPFFNSSKKAAEFREWLESTGGTSEKLPENSFKNSERSTGVNTRLVVIDKTEGSDVPQKKKPIVRSSRDTNTSNSEQPKGLTDTLKESYETLKNKNDIFEINKDIVSEMQGKNVADKIYSYFKSIGGSIENPVLGTVELTKSGAKSTVFHGVGRDKIKAVGAIKSVIENGAIVSKTSDWKNRGYDTYIIAGKGNIDGKKSVVGVIVKAYPSDNQKGNKFYLHELIKIGADSDAVAKDSQTNVNESTPINNDIISHNENIVNTYSTQNNNKYSAVSGEKGNIRSSRDMDTSVADYSYKTLTDKSDMAVTLINNENIRTSDGRIDRRSAIEKGLENVRQKNNPKNTEANSFVYIPDIDRNVLVTKDGLRHGLTRNAEATAKVTAKIGDILENSIKVNELLPRNTSKGGYVLLGIGADESGNYYPTRVVVNNFSVDEVEVLDVLYAVNAKRRASSQMRQGFTENSAPLIKGSSKISIAELLNLVKDNFSDVLTDDVLKQFGAERKNSSLSDSIRYSTNSDFDSSRWMTEHAGPAEEKKKKPNNKQENLTLSDIIKDISDKFNIPITTGKVTDKAASGIYKETPEAIRTRIANNLPTISHELGHHLDKKYNLSNLKSIDKLKEAIPEDFLKNYSKEEQSGEAVAEFVRTYLKNVNEANKLCSDFYSDFISALSKSEANADFKALNNIASMANEYLSYDIAQRYSTVITSSNKKEKLPFSERWHKFYENWVDKFHSQKRVVDYVETASGKTLSGEKNAYILATNSLNAHTIANFLICEGFRDLKGNIIDAKSFIECIGKVNSKDVKVFDEYLMLRHSLEWIAPTEPDVTKKRVFADDTLEDVDKIKTQIADLEKAHPKFKEAAENLYEYQYNLLKYFVVQGGGMTEQTLEDLRRKYPSYVPFYRAVKNKGWFAKSPFANQTTPISKAKGSGELIISPTESIIRNTEKMVKFALRNQVMQAFASYADTVDGFGQFMEKVPPDMIPHTVNISGMKESFTDALQQVVNSGKDYFAVSDLFEELFGDTVTDFTPVANANKRIVTVMKGGKPSYYQIHNEAFYKSVAELSPKQAEGILKISQMIMQPMKLLITQNNPVFAVTNAIRDYGTAYKLSEINNPVVFTQKYIQALGGIISNSDAYKQYKAMGGGHSSELSANIENISKTLRDVAQKDMGKARRLAYSVFRHPVETVASLNDVIESTPRFMEFQRTLDGGGDLQKAIYNADDLTTNFKKSGGGATAKAMNKLIMFNNAAIQGVDKLYRTITDKDAKRRNKKFLKWVLHALIMGVIGYVYNKSVDEEGYKNLSSYKKNNFYNFAIGDGKFISLPKPRENALLDSFTERTIEYLAAENKDAFYGFGDYVTSQLLPPMLPNTVNPVDALHQVGGSTVLGGLIDVGFNKDFKDSPIESEYDKYLPSNERYNENTSKAAYWLGQTSIARNADMSPKKIDHLISSYTGILGQANKALFPMSKERVDYSIGLRNKFISDSNYSTDVLNKLYENRDIAEREYKYKSTADNAVEYEQNAIVTAYISEVNKMIKAMPAEQQRNGRAFLLRSLNAWNYNETASQSKIVSRFKNDDVTKNCIITNVPKSTIEWTKNKVKYSYQLTPQQYNAYIKDYLTLIENYRSVQFKKYKNKADCMAALEDTSKEVKKILNKKYQKKYLKKAEKVKAG